MGECAFGADVSWLTVSIVRGEEQVSDEGGKNRPQD